MLAEDQETRRVVRLVLDVLDQLGQVVAGSRCFPGDGRRPRLLGGLLGGLGVTAD